MTQITERVSQQLAEQWCAAKELELLKAWVAVTGKAIFTRDEIKSRCRMVVIQASKREIFYIDDIPVLEFSPVDYVVEDMVLRLNQQVQRYYEEN